jgi:hypothetical protein
MRPPGRGHNGRRRGGSSAGQSSGLIIRQVVGSSPTRPTEFGVDSLKNWHQRCPAMGCDQDFGPDPHYPAES